MDTEAGLEFNFLQHLVQARVLCLGYFAQVPPHPSPPQHRPWQVGMHFGGGALPTGTTVMLPTICFRCWQQSYGNVPSVVKVYLNTVPSPFWRPE